MFRWDPGHFRVSRILFAVVMQVSRSFGSDRDTETDDRNSHPGAAYSADSEKPTKSAPFLSGTV
jgi:hypothetical protein